MKGFAEVVVFFLIALVWMATEWASNNKQNIAFTIGLASIVIGCALERLSLAFIVFGVLTCGLLILGRLLAIRAASIQPKEAKDA